MSSFAQLGFRDMRAFENIVAQDGTGALIMQHCAEGTDTRKREQEKCTGQSALGPDRADTKMLECFAFEAQSVVLRQSPPADSFDAPTIKRSFSRWQLSSCGMCV
jgi:hypothetical protein